MKCSILLACLLAPSVVHTPHVLTGNTLINKSSKSSCIVCKCVLSVHACVCVCVCVCVCDY